LVFSTPLSNALHYWDVPVIPGFDCMEQLPGSNIQWCGAKSGLIRRIAPHPPSGFQPSKRLRFIVPYSRE